MGLDNCNPAKLSRLNVDQILTNINRLFTGMLIRGTDIEQIKGKIISRIQTGQITDIEGWKNFINGEIYNSEFSKTTQALFLRQCKMQNQIKTIRLFLYYVFYFYQILIKILF